MADKKVFDRRVITKGAGVVRIEVWQNQQTMAITRYAMAYINHGLCDADNGRCVGFDNAHAYANHPTKHHRHWMGVVSHNKNFVSVDQTTARFERILKWLKRRYAKRY
jgi:Family of unknown function (DUF6516)